MVIKCGSLTAAAEELGYTLSESSRSMKTLEESVTGGRKISGIYQNRRSDAINVQFVMETIKIVLSSGSMIY